MAPTRLNLPLAMLFHLFFAPECDLSLYLAADGVAEKKRVKAALMGVAEDVLLRGKDRRPAVCLREGGNMVVVPR
jgi:hypothetical protein